jgi:enterochelin esterase family protein
MHSRRLASGFLTTSAFVLASVAVMAQQAAGRAGGTPAPPVVSPEVTTDRHIVFRVNAPQAQRVRLSAGDIPGLGQTGVFAKNDAGVWELTIGPIDPGSYRYNINVDGVAVIDPRNPATSESNTNTWSVVHVPGSPLMDTREVPHGAVAEVHYYSTALKRFRRMHVYTPPGYETGSAKYPVFYLLHGAGDSDDSWTSEGRANFILDNLIAGKKARPMIVVMPAGHTTRANGIAAADEFTRDFVSDIRPHIEKNYRVVANRANRAIAGLSMGGSQTLNIAIPDLDDFGYIGVFSSGLLNAFGAGGRGRGAATTEAPPAAAPGARIPWEEQNLVTLENAALKKGLKLLWFSTGKDDFLIETTRQTVDLLKRHGFTVTFQESAGGHTWINWRNYLIEFAPLLFAR